MDASSSPIRLSVLGPPLLESEHGSSSEAVLRQPKQLALLTYLYLAVPTCGRFVRRDAVIVTFWPDVPDSRARQSLRQALHQLRRSLGVDPFVVRGDELGIDRTMLQCDVAEFEEAALSGDLDSALALYKGDLLPAFHCPAAPDFEYWLDAERRRLRRLASSAADTLAAKWQAAGDCDRAAHYARRAVQLADGDEAFTRRLIMTLLAAGDRLGAFAAYEELKQRLHVNFGAEPSTATLRLEGVLRQPAESPEPVEAVLRCPQAVESAACPASDQMSASVHAPPPAGETRAWPAKLRFVVASGLVAVLLYSAGGSSGGSLRVTPASEGDSFHILVEDFSEYTMDGFAAELADAVTAEAQRLLGTAYGVVISLPQVRGVGSSLPELTLRGALFQATDGLRLNLRLIDTRSGVVLESGAVEMPSSHPQVATELARHAAAFVRRCLDRRRLERSWSAASSNSQALRFMHTAILERAKADSLHRAGGHNPALRLYDRADSLLFLAHSAAPDWGEPVLQLGKTSVRRYWAYLGRDSLAAARAALSQGLAHIDERLRWNPQGIDAQDARAQLAYWLVTSAPPDSAIWAARAASGVRAALEQVLARDPYRPHLWALLSAILQTQGEFADAYLAAERAYRLNTFLHGQVDIAARLFELSLEVGDRKGAEQWCIRFRTEVPETWLPVYCELTLLAWSASVSTTDAVRAAELVAQAHSLPTGIAARLRLTAAVVAAKAEALELVRNHEAELLGSWKDDVHLLAHWAWLDVASGNHASAANRLVRYAQLSPHWGTGVARSKRFEELPH